MNHHQPTKYVRPGKNYPEPKITDITQMYQEWGDQGAESHDSAITQSLGSLIYSVPYMAICALIVGAIALIVWWFAQDRIDLPIIGLVSLVIWGGMSYYILAWNRQQGLDNSPAGIEHHKIESREEIAKYIIDAHVYLLERQWEREDESESAYSLPGPGVASSQGHYIETDQEPW